MNEPINVVVSYYPTLAIYYDAQSMNKEISRRKAKNEYTKKSFFSQSAAREVDSCAWKIRWTTQKAGKFETLMGVYNFPTNNLMLTGSLDLQGLPFRVSPLVLEKLEELHQEFLVHPELVVRLQTTHPTTSVHRPDFDLALSA